MKKTKLSVGLVTTFIAALGLSACSTTTESVTDGKGAIVTITGYDGVTETVTADFLYGEYLKDTSKISSFYDSVVENLIRYTYEKTSFVKDNNDKPEDQRLVLLKTNGQIETDSALAIRKAKEKAQANAKTNGTTYSEEWEAILDENGVETEAELKETYRYKYEKEEYERWFLKTNLSSLTSQYISTGSTEDIDSKYPYHVRHILIKVDGGGTEYVRGTITKDEAEHLAIVMGELIDETKVGGTDSYLYSFGKVAEANSDFGDSSSAVKGGDVGIVTTTTSFVNEFKLGMYAYDMVFNGDTHEDAGTGDVPSVADAKKGVGITSDIEAKIKAVGLKTVPYDAFVQIGKVADVTTDVNKLEVNENNSAYYPRNVYWNNYLNLHEPFVITNQKLDAKTGQVSLTEKISNSRFNKDGILTDEEGRVIIGVRSEHGIHLMIMQKSIFNDEVEVDAGSKKDVTLSQYYTTYTPDSINYPGNVWKTEEGKKVVDSTNAKVTYVNYIPGSDDATLKERAEEVESEIEGFDSTYSYRMYTNLNKYLRGKGVTVNYTKGIDTVINDYIKTLKTTNKNNRSDDLADAWDTYLKLLELETIYRTTEYKDDEGKVIMKTVYDDEGKESGTSSETRLVNPVCAVRFQSAKSDKNYTEKGGLCYYEK